MSELDTPEERKAALLKRKSEQARDGEIARREYQEGTTRMQAKTARLRAIRMAKEAADAIVRPVGSKR